MKLFDAKYGHEVGRIEGSKLVSRWGWSFLMKGNKVVDSDGDIVGWFDCGKFYNRDRQHMATAGEQT